MNKLYVDSFVEKKIKRGIQLLDGRDFHQLDFDNQSVAVYNHSHQFLGTAYLSRQNKGIGWFLGPRKIELTESYFVDLFTKAKKQRQNFENSDLTTAYRLLNQDVYNFKLKKSQENKTLISILNKIKSKTKNQKLYNKISGFSLFYLINYYLAAVVSSAFSVDVESALFKDNCAQSFWSTSLL